MLQNLKKQLTEKLVINKELIETHKCRFMGLLQTYKINNEMVTMLNKDVGGAVVIPIDEDGNVYLETQYRFPIGRILLEAPAGKLDSKDEEYIECARRELLEETGCIADEIVELIRYYANPDFTDEEIAIFLAKNVRKVDVQKLDIDETVNVVKMPLGVALELVKDGVIIDQRTIIGLGLAKLQYNVEKKNFDKTEILKKLEEDAKILFEEKIGENYSYEINDVVAIDNIVKIPNGETSFREVFYLKPRNIIIPVEQYKMGVVIKDKPIINKREISFLEEHEGVKVDFGEQATSVGFANEVAKVYITTDKIEDCIYLEGSDIINLIKEGYIKDGLTLATIFKVIISFS